MENDAGAGSSSHWDDVYVERRDDVSWFQDVPHRSLDVFDRCAVPASASVLDVGGGAGRLVDHLLARGHRDLTVVDLSAAALNLAAERLHDPPDVEWVTTDLRNWRPGRGFDVWHDRAALHFLTEAADLGRYAELVREHLSPGGLLVVAAFALDGPEQCSGLPVRRHDVRSLQQVFGTDLSVVLEEREDHRTPWDAVQPFTWVAFRHRPDQA
jgi:SAM-dependent methyltransferase